MEFLNFNTYATSSYRAEMKKSVMLLLRGIKKKISTDILIIPTNATSTVDSFDHPFSALSLLARLQLYLLILEFN